METDLIVLILLVLAVIVFTWEAVKTRGRIAIGLALFAAAFAVPLIAAELKG